MEDLQYIVSLGFSGSDVWRAVLLAFLFAMVSTRQSDVWRMGAFALIIDRVIWPMSAMLIAGAELSSVYASFGAMFSTFIDDIGIYLVRYLGLCLMMSAFVALRRRLHHVKPAKPKQKPAYPY